MPRHENVQPIRLSKTISDMILATAEPAVARTIVGSIGLFAARTVAPFIVTGATYTSIWAYAAIVSTLQYALSAPSTWFYNQVITQYLGDSAFLSSRKDDAFELATAFGAAAITATVLGIPVSSMFACVIISEVLGQLLGATANSIRHRRSQEHANDAPTARNTALV